MRASHDPRVPGAARPNPAADRMPAALLPATGRRPAAFLPARRKRRRRIRFALSIAIPFVSGLVAVLVVAQALGYFGGTVTITAVTVTDSAQVLNATPVRTSYSSPTGGAIVLQIFAWNTMTGAGGNGPVMGDCTLGASVSPNGFSVEAITPSYLCLPAQNGTVVYVTLGVPARPYSGPVSLQIDDVVTTQPN